MGNLEQEAMKNVATEKLEEKQFIEGIAADQAGEQPPENLIRIDFSFLLKKTGSGTVETYLDHPMNPKRSRGRGRFLRGCTGIAGDLDLAIIDIALGAFEMIMERKAGNGTD